MGRLQRMRSAITGRFVGSFEGIDHPDTTVMETYGDANKRVELWAAAEAVILGAGYPVDGRSEVNETDLDRLRAAVEHSMGQP